MLVSGGCGFIGKNLVAELLKLGADVSVLDLPSADWRNLPKRVKHIEADILDKASLVGSCADIDIVYHLAARTDLDGKNIGDYRINFEGTKNLIAECRKSKNIKRLVFYSTQLVVGLFNETRFIDESESYRTKTIYGQSKIDGEKVVIQHCAKAAIPYTIIRPTSVYGPWGEAPYKDFFRTIKKGRYVHVGKASNLVSMVYVKNLVQLTILSSLEKKAENEIIFGNDFHPYTMREFADAVAQYYKLHLTTVPNALITIVAYAFAVPKMLGISVPIYPFRLKNIKANYCYDIQKSVDLGYNPQYDLVQGVNETLDWYEDKRLI